ncbi:tRNA pseudouridine(38-40) synthase TruA [Bacillus tuaregi]|uniref:tRNA pseudouridine(38-40) synthase TruA n=1 Tax=Bacillus tuaregi TaxID=1816695 RepID=UPI0008F8C176|nr:tRNA pseudouridine(38-40) synthase TruA [Bacillus tuaregi]
MQRYKCTISYDGTMFSGYQVQPNNRTVQSEIEAALEKLHKGNPVRITSSGRTDAGVHARGQVIHFDSPLQIPEDRWVKALHSLLSDEIAVRKVEKAAPDFHARFDAKGKEYRYYVRMSDARDPFTRHYQYQYGYGLDIDQMKAAAAQLIGTHDFTSFCSAKTEVDDRVRTIHLIDIEQDGERLMFRFAGNGFLYNMVRILVGTLLEAGRGMHQPEDMKRILFGKDRSLAGKTAPAHGLYLWEVYY